MPTSIDGVDLSALTIDGTEVQEITSGGDVVYSALTLAFDSFEDGDINEYTSDGDPSGWTVTNNLAFDGSYSLYYSGGTADPIYRTDQTFARGEEFTTHIYGDSADTDPRFQDPSIWFGVQDSSNYYRVAVEGMGTETFNISKIENGSGTTLDSIENPSGGTQDEWTDLEIQYYDNGDILVDWVSSDGTYSLSANDSTFGDGGYGWQQSGSGEFYIDYLRNTATL